MLVAAAAVLLCAVCCRSSAISSSLDLSLRTLDGSHIRPMEQALVDLPPEVARVANQAAATGGTLLGGRGPAASCAESPLSCAASIIA